MTCLEIRLRARRAAFLAPHCIGWQVHVLYTPGFLAPMPFRFAVNRKLVAMLIEFSGHWKNFP